MSLQSASCSAAGPLRELSVKLCPCGTANGRERADAQGPCEGSCSVSKEAQIIKFGINKLKANSSPAVHVLKWLFVVEINGLI